MSLDLVTLPFVPNGGDTPISLVKEDLDHIITNDLNNSPRSLQIEIGPSEINHKCARWLGYKQLATPTINEQGLAWRPAVGTGVHSLLEGVFRRTNEMLGTTRFLIEQRVTIGDVCGQPIRGSCDLADRVNGITVDWKIVGPTTLRRVKAEKKPSDEYRAQAHAYARGFNTAGVPMDRVSIYYLPSNGEFAEGYFWSESYDEQIVLNALKRLEAITTLTKSMGTAALGLLPTADAYCTRCPYHRAGSQDLAQGCPGDPAALNRATNSITSLIA
ncbi:hypothetical protein FH608_005480 [Nonomuraea phyllanthi]|uniref:PD-(D/E)XK nuclease family protein n=1 Tax=Nonomuraea phyllanthi TaxID=2219224 RepID=A0A5C4WTN4_9ACTN|nr:hypothetical protein [Nonomuraea phyllanthi]KAB8196228.1 hypothetical protein FH608_005480 [Nonomuraea phyllanthi]